jgi:putative membrane protein
VTEPAPELLVEPAAEVGWRRLDAKMLLVHPVSELGRLAVPLLAIVLIGSHGIDVWHSAVVAIPVVLGMLRWFTTEFRITDEHLELRAGLLSRRIKRARLDKVRTVALDASPIHRLLGLAKVRVGTGDEKGLELNALGTDEARALRESLLHRAEVATAAAPGTASEPAPLSRTDEVLLRFDPRWLRLAPFTGTGIAIAAAAAAAGTGPLRDPVGRLLRAMLGSVEKVPVVELVLGGALALVLVLTVLSIAGYALTNWGFLVARDLGGRSWHVSHGLLSKIETSIDTSRVRGFSVCRGAGLRLVGGGSARVLVTGLKKARREEAKGSTQLAPAAPYDVVRGLCVVLAGDADAVDAALVPHTTRARRRQGWRLLRAWAVVLIAMAIVAAATSEAWVLLLPLGLLPLVVAGAVDRYRGLGHLLTTHHLVIGMPKVNRHRHLLLRRGIIGWKLRQTWFQRRAGLVTLVATTAAGEKSYPLIDLLETAAVPLADAALPGLVEQFLVTA